MNTNKFFKGCLFLVFLSLFCGRMTGVDWGIKFGLNSANFVVSDKTLQGSHHACSDYIIGVYLSFHLSKALAVQPEIYFTYEGSDYSWKPYGIDKYHFKFKMPSFQVPLLLKMDIPLDENITPSLFAGPYIGMMSKATFSRVIDHGSEEEFGQRVDITDYIKDIDYGVVFGAGIDVGVCFGKLTVDFRYNFGLTNIAADFGALAGFMADDAILKNEYAAGRYSEMKSIKNKSFIILLGVGF